MPLKPDFHPPIRINDNRHHIPIQQRLIQGILTLIHPPLLILNPLPTPRVAQPIRRRSHRQSINHRHLCHNYPSRQICLSPRRHHPPACHHKNQRPPILHPPTPYVTHFLAPNQDYRLWKPSFPPSPPSFPRKWESRTPSAAIPALLSSFPRKWESRIPAPNPICPPNPPPNILTTRNWLCIINKSIPLHIPF